ncbi:hypothetical protein [Clostridium sp.]|nr:hypothetical protein [uncultured Clostridium sp.]
MARTGSLSNLLFMVGLKEKNALTTIMFICLLFAVGDEFHRKVICSYN